MMKAQARITKALPAFSSMVRHFAPDVAAQRWRILAAIATMLAGVAMQLLEPWPLKFVIDALTVDPMARSSAQNWFSLETTLFLSAAAYVAIVTLRATAEYRESVAFAVIGNRVVSRIRTRLYRQLQMLPLSFHHRSRQGDLLVRMLGDVKMLREVAVTAVLPLIGGVLVLWGMTGVMLWLNWRLALIAIVAIPFFALSTLRLGKRIHEAARDQRKREGAVAAMAAEAIASIQVVQALSLESQFEDSFNTSDEQSARDEVKTRKLTAKLSRWTDVLIAAATAMVLWYGGRQALAGSLSPGDLIVFLTYLKRGLRPLQDMARYAARLSKATAAGERIIELLDAKSDVADRPGATDAPQLRGAIEFDTVTFEYDSGVTVLDQFSVNITPGEFVAIVGPSGVGKSTILNLLSRFYEPTRGAIRIDGHDVHDWTITSVRSQMSIVLQDTVLFAANVWDNIAFGALGASRAAIKRAAKLAEADDFIRNLPRGYDTVLGERGVNLSQGQRQRIAIARALVRNAPIALLDEPATALDQQQKRLVRDALHRLAQGRTTVLVTHDLADAQRADRVLVLEHGQVVEHGAPHKLLSLGGRFAEMYRLQTMSTDA
ncbi:MAG: ABC transporter ATP-binding protein [Planctomycetota bacterium]|nr:ABC transporter ATP-binding protein [Planctomycetota bacterium]MDA1177461.1 ABC transporter ATP-binding protein [Planctomycetota bacterium]